MNGNSTLGRVYGSGFLFNVAFLTFAVLIPLDAVHQHLAVWIVGVLAAIPGVLQLPSRILSGPLVDWLGERWVLRLTFSLAVLAGFAVAAGHVFPMTALIVGQLLIGAARGFFWTAAQSAVSRDTEGRAHHVGLFTSYTKSGALVGIAAAGGIAQLMGITGGFLFSAGLSLVAFMMALTLPKHAWGQKRPQGLLRAVRRLGPAGQQPFVVVNGLVALLCAIPQSLAQSFYPVILIRLGLPDTQASLITALMGLGMIVSGMMGAAALQRTGMRRLVAIAAGLLAISLSATAIHQVFMDAAAIFAAGFAAGWLNVAFLTAVSARSQDSDRATNLGVTQVFFVLAMMFTPLLSGWLMTLLGRSATFLIEGVGALAVAGLIMVLWNWQNRSGPLEPARESA